jgi:hypothetical protein
LFLRDGSIGVFDHNYSIINYNTPIAKAIPVSDIIDEIPKA